MFDWLKSDSSLHHFGLRSRSPDSGPGPGSWSPAAPEDSFRQFSREPGPGGGWLSLDQVADQALRSRAQWLAQRGVAVHLTPGAVFIRSDAAAVRRIVDDLIQWAAAKATDLVITTGGAGPGNPNLLVRARLASPQAGAALQTNPDPQGLQRQFRRLDVRTFVANEPHCPCFGVEFPGGTACGAVMPERGCGRPPAANEGLLARRRLALVSHNEALRRTIRNLTRGLGLSVRAFATVAQALQDAARYRPHAVLCDSSIDAAAMRSLHKEMSGDKAVSFLCVHEGSADFHVTQLGGVTTGHLGLDSLEQALVPALAFTLRRH